MDPTSLFWCAKGHLNLDQANYIQELVKQIDPKSVLETGFCTGRSTYAVLSNANSLEKMISIDIDFNYIKPDGQHMRDLLTLRFPKLQTIEKSSKDVLTADFMRTEFPSGIDWATIDGDHTYSGCLFDLEAVYRYVNKGGLMIIDDYEAGPPNGTSIPEVTKACDDFHKSHPEISREKWNNRGKGFCVFRF